MKEKFLEIVRQNIKRIGIDKLLDWLETTDFYSAPASTRFHGDYEGGLLYHSINVHENLVKLNSIYNLCENQETLAIISLFHDLTKIGCYKADTRNVKNENGVWEKIPYFSFEEQFPFGSHGGKSVYLIQKYMMLTDEEAVAINTHMGNTDKPNGDYSITNAFNMFPLSALLHVADMISTFVTENEKEITEENNTIDSLIQNILTLCKKNIEKGIDKEEIYDIISNENNGKKNPNSIKDIETGNKIIVLLNEKLNEY